MSRITLGNVTIDRNRFEAWVGERHAGLTYLEFELLYQLAKNAGKVVTRARLMSAVWNEPASGENPKLTVHMSRLRSKMRGSAPWRIETVKKRGYALINEDAPPDASAERPRGSGRSRMLGRPA